MIRHDDGASYWRRTSRLMVRAVMAWLVIGFVLPVLGSLVPGPAILGIPLGFLLASEGCLLGFVLLVFWHTNRQNGIDEDCHAAED